MSLLVDRAIVAHGLLPLADARRHGDLERVRDLAAALETADVLAVGALADRVRAEEVGDIVRVLVDVEADSGPDVVRVSLADARRSGLEALRRVAIARITGPRAARVRIDGSETGLPLAEVALGFGASELVWAPEHATSGRDQLETIVARVGRRAVFLSGPGPAEITTDA